jgi:flagellar motor switch protein FliM
VLEAVHAAFARSVAVSLASYLRSALHVSLLSLTQLTYEEFVRSLPDPTVIAVITMSPLQGRAIVELDPGVAFWMMERLLGAEEGEVLEMSRPLTQVERAAMEGPLSHMLAELGSAWQEHMPAKPSLVEIIHTPAAAQIAKPTEAVVAASFEFSAGRPIGRASICMPAIALKLARVEAGTGIPEVAAVPDEASRRGRLEAMMASISVPCTVRLGLTDLALTDLAGLQEGDVVCLNHRACEPLELHVGNVPRFHCRPRSAGGRLAVEILGKAP